ncbi:MAG: 23S rRNA (guanosine(2251)-2'-O)-methyltransferase RlmB [Alphaproteobacteria bacterium]
MNRKVFRRDRPRPSAARPSTRASAQACGGARWLYGRHAVAAALANPRRSVHELVATAEALTRAPELERARPGLAIRLADRAAIGALLPPGAVHQGLALRVDPLPEPTLEAALAPGRGTIVVLDHVTDPHNVGAVVRSAAVFGAAAVVVTTRHAAPAGASMAKSASGALDIIPLVPVVNLARALATIKRAGYWCVGLDAAGEAELTAAALPGPAIALVLGAEGEGLRRLTRERCDVIARLPTAGRLVSLNVSAAAAIALYVCFTALGPTLAPGEPRA